MSKELIEGSQFMLDFEDGYLTWREAKENHVDPQLRTLLHSRECAGRNCPRISEREARDYFDLRGQRGLLNLLVVQSMQGEIPHPLFSPSAEQFLHNRAMEHLEKIFPQINFISRGRDDLVFLYEGVVFTHASNQLGTRFEIDTGFLRETSEVTKIQLFHDLLLDGPGLFLAVPDEENRRMFLPMLQLMLRVQDAIPKLHELAYSMEPTLRVFQVDEQQVLLEAFRWRREGEAPSNYIVDEDGNDVPSDVQEVVLKVNTVTQRIVEEQPGQLPR